MTDLGGEARDLLRAARREGQVDPEAVARVRSAVVARMAGTVAGAGTLAGTTKAATAAKGWGLLTWKTSAIALFSAVVSAVAGAAPAPAPLVMQPSNVTARPRVAPAPSSSVTFQPAPAPIEAEVPAPSVARRRPEPTKPWAVDLERLREAQRSLASGDVASARRIAETMSTDSPFEDEREALIAIAACRASAGDAEGLARAFIAKRNGTTLAQRVADSCTAR